MEKRNQVKQQADVVNVSGEYLCLMSMNRRIASADFLIESRPVRGVPLSFEAQE